MIPALQHRLHDLEGRADGIYVGNDRILTRPSTISSQEWDIIVRRFTKKPVQRVVPATPDDPACWQRLETYMKPMVASFASNLRAEPTFRRNPNR